MGHHRGLGAGGLGQPGGVSDCAQPVGTGAEVNPGGRGCGPQPGQERVLLQDAGTDHRRRDRRHGWGG